MKKLFIVVLAISVASFMDAQQAQPPAGGGGGGVPGVVILKDGKQVNVDGLEVDVQGTITYKTGKFTEKKKKGEYKDAYLKDDPKDITEAKKLLKSNPLGAASAYSAAFAKYQYLGYDIACIYGEGKGYADGGKKDQAIAALEKLLPLKNSISGEKKEKDFAEGLKILQLLYIEKKDYAKADQVAALMSKSDDDGMAASALMGRGRMLEDQGKAKDAVLIYMRVALLYPKEIKDRPQAIYNVARLMKGMNDARWQDWSKMLQEQYPENPLVKQL